MTDGGVQQLSLWPIVATDAGPVTLATVDQLEPRAAQWRVWAERSRAELQSLRKQEDDHPAAAGAFLGARASDWTVPPDLHQRTIE